MTAVSLVSPVPSDVDLRALARVAHIEAVAPAQVTSYVLFTGAGSLRNQRMYKKAGFRLRPDLASPQGAVVLTKRRLPGTWRW